MDRLYCVSLLDWTSRNTRWPAGAEEV